MHDSDLGVPGLGGFHRWCGLDVVGVLGTDARTGLGELGGPERAVGPLEDWLQLYSEGGGEVVRRHPLLSSM